MGPRVLARGPERPYFVASRGALKALCQRNDFLPSSCRSAATDSASAAGSERPILLAIFPAFCSAQL